MNNKKAYIGIDYFRIVAAFLIIAIHTSPLISYSDTADFVLTRVIARVAVPFFFMSSGFFLISEQSFSSDKLKKFIKQTAIIYAIAILIYIPINIYNKYFEMDKLLPNIFKDILFDGTFYHLWYLPAAIIGATISYLLVKKIGYKWSLGITTILYLIGLFGDSYFGVSEQIPLLKNIYIKLFDISDYTRNGVFFAPIFFVLGGIIANKKLILNFWKNIIGLSVTLLLMIIEALFLHKGILQRHDCMYLMLVPCMFFLFNVLTFFKGDRNIKLRTFALIIYIIHPIMIIFIRIIAKIFELQNLLIDNSLYYYLSVGATSTIGTFIILALKVRIKFKAKQICLYDTDRAWVEVDLNNLKHNANVLQSAMPSDCKLMAVVKAEGYGHGGVEVSKSLNEIGISAFAVATIDEGIKLRINGIKGEILILGYTNPLRAKEICKFNLIQTLINYDYAVELNKQGYKIKSHIKIDTGMHRLGFDNDNARVENIFKSKYLEICGIYTHLCTTESLETEYVNFTKMQILKFEEMLENLTKKGIEIPKIHIQSSYGLLNYSDLKCDYCRIGIALYGVLSSSKNKTNLQLDLHPVLSLKTRVILIREIAKGDSVGYDRKFIASRNSKIAVLPIGYADGLPRNLSCGKGKVIINGKLTNIIGQICMDQLTIDITDIDNINIGDIVTIIGKDGQYEILATEVAENSDSITNELLSRMGNRLKFI